MADIDHIIEEIEELNDIDPCASLLANALSDFIYELEEIPTEDILSEDEIIKLIQEEMCDENDNDDSEEELVLVSPGKALRSLQTWITFFE